MSVLNLFEQAGRYVTTWSLQLVIVVGVIWIAVYCDRRHRSQFRYSLFSLALAVSLVVPWAPQKISSFSWMVHAKEVWTDPSGTGSTIAQTNAAPVALQVTNNETHVAVPVQPDPAFTKSRVTSAIPLRIIGLLWLLGTLAAGTRKIRQHWKLSGIVSRAEVVSLSQLASGCNDTSLPILLSREVSGPMLYGWLRPVILLPENILEWSTPEARKAILLHECVHFNRKDHWVSTLEGFVRIVLFFHPLVRWMCSQLDIERELVCDAEVLRLGAEPSAYAETLVLVATHAVANQSGVHFSAAAQLNRRIELLFRMPRMTRRALLAVPFVLLTPLAALSFWQARVESLALMESSWVSKFLPLVPKETPAFVSQSTTAAPTTLAPSVGQDARAEQFSRLEQYYKIVTPQQTPSLNSVVTVLKGQGAANEVRIALGVPYGAMTFSEERFGFRASGTYAIQLTYLSGKVAGRGEEAFDIDIPRTIPTDGMAVMQQAFLLKPGLYRLFALVTDTASRNVFTLESRLEVPEIPPNALATSSLVVADDIDSLESTIFTIGGLRVRPSLTNKFRQVQDLCIFQQVYNPSINTLILETLITANGQEFNRTSEQLQKTYEITITKRIPLSDFPPGSYGIQTTITDQATGQAVVSKAQFSVE